MKVLMVHNRYQQRGGEDAVVQAEAAMLAGRGVQVEMLEADNDAIQGTGAKIQVAVGQLTGSPAMRARIGAALSGFRPDVVHVHNWFPTVSAAIFGQCKAAGVPVVHTLHNFRLLCVGATLFRDGHVCEDCIGTRMRLPGIVHKCYRESAIGSAVGTMGMLAHWASGTWRHSVDRFIALTEFSRRKFVQGGLPEGKIVVKPNFVESGIQEGPGAGGYFLYAGRLTEEKGIRTLIECWKDAPDLPRLLIAGDGPLREEVRQATQIAGNMEWLGLKNSEEILRLMADAKAILCPSLWYEGMPRVVIESLAVGTPVIASRIGGYPEMFEDGRSGVLFTTGDARELRDRIRALDAQHAFAAMRPMARQRFLSEYTEERNFDLLLKIYREATLPCSAGYSVAASPGACPL